MRNVGRIEENVLVILNSSKRGRPGYSGYCIWFQTPIHVLLIVEGKTDEKAELSLKHARRSIPRVRLKVENQKPSVDFWSTLRYLNLNSYSLKVENLQWVSDRLQVTNTLPSLAELIMSDCQLDPSGVLI
ncbi:hypothetical protein ACFX2A_001644 [Malus domestica]